MGAHPHPPHAHHPASAASGPRYLVAIGLNVAIVVIEVVMGLRIGSAALLADAGHNASDVVGLLLAGGAAWLMTRPGSARFTYGYGKAGILAALGNGLLLVFACGALAFEAIDRLAGAAAAPAGLPVMAVAGLAVVVNLLSALALRAGDAHDVNRRAAVLHLLADAGVSFVVVLAGALIWWTGARWIDPIATLLVVAAILASTWRLLARSLALALDATPEHIDAEAVRSWLRTVPGVADVHDLHIWPMSATDVALTAHLTVPDGGDDTLLRAIGEGLATRFGLRHATLQLETSGLDVCDPCDGGEPEGPPAAGRVRPARA
jgi:cobalt-zinc-cadmium efflux system protein